MQLADQSILLFLTLLWIFFFFYIKYILCIPDSDLITKWMCIYLQAPMVLEAGLLLHSQAWQSRHSAVVLSEGFPQLPGSRHVLALSPGAVLASLRCAEHSGQQFLRKGRWRLGLPCTVLLWDSLIISWCFLPCPTVHYTGRQPKSHWDVFPTYILHTAHTAVALNFNLRVRLMTSETISVTIWRLN